MARYPESEYFDADIYIYLHYLKVLINVVYCFSSVWLIRFQLYWIVMNISDRFNDETVHLTRWTNDFCVIAVQCFPRVTHHGDASWVCVRDAICCVRGETCMQHTLTHSCAVEIPNARIDQCSASLFHFSSMLWNRPPLIVASFLRLEYFQEGSIMTPLQTKLITFFGTGTPSRNSD